MPPQRASEMLSDINRLRTALGTTAEVRAPREAEEPILAPPVRLAIFQWLSEIRAAAELASVGLHPRTTAILHGPPGTGKTTLAHHLSARLNYPLVIVGAETLVSKYLGDSARNMAALFQAVSEASTPCILFLDELDAVGLSRDSIGDGQCGSELKSMLTVLLRKIEEYRGYCIGATNRPKVLDPALWRRFHMQICVDLPGYEERWAILKRYAAPFELQDEFFDTLTDLTEGASPALLRGLMEGMKRSLVIGPRIKLPIDRADKVFAPIVIALQPPPELPNTPPLWGEKKALSALAGLPWPPELPKKEAA